jgi:hypothetical protein
MRSFFAGLLSGLILGTALTIFAALWPMIGA